MLFSSFTLLFESKIKLKCYLYMGKLRSHCTTAFPARKRLYLNFYSTDFNNFFFKSSLASILLTVKISSLCLSLLRSSQARKVQKSGFLEDLIHENHFSVR